MSTAVLGFYEPERRSDVFRWSVAGVVVLAAHLGIAAAYVHLRPEPADQAQAPVIAVEFAPAPVEPPPAVEATQEMVPPPPPDAPEPPPQPQSPPETQAMVAPSEEPEVEMPPPPRPVPMEQPKQLPARAPERPRPHEPPKKSPTTTHVQPSRAATAPTAGAAAIGARQAHSSWLSLLAAHLARYKRYPPEAVAQRSAGTVRLSFTMDRSGRVVSRHIEGSSGSAALDHEALSMIDRAQPLPVPPDMAEPRKTLNVPIHFSMPGG